MKTKRQYIDLTGKRMQVSLLQKYKYKIAEKLVPLKTSLFRKGMDF